MLAAPLLKKWLTGAAIVMAVLFAIYQYGESKERQGAKKAVLEFIEQDLEGADKVRERANEILDGLDDGIDPDDLLRSTGGFRDEPGDVPPAE